jgi:hypothetical protein
MFDRKSFLVAGTMLGALVPAWAKAQSASSAPSPSPSPIPDDIPEYHLDLGAFDSALTRAVSHRHLFSAKYVQNGAVLATMRTVLRSYASIGIAANDVLPVGVLYHTAVAIAFNDAVWNELLIPSLAKFPKDVQTDIGARAAGSGNPFLHSKPENARFDASIEALIADAGARFFVCNVALSGYATEFAGIAKSDPAVVYERLRANLVPNAMPAPTGSWAIHAVQERHFTLQQTSL